MSDASLIPKSRIVQAHLRSAWLGLLVFVTFGIALELLHAFKSEAYLGVHNETRRLMWTLAHAHGVGLSLVHLGFCRDARATLRDAERSAGPGFAPAALVGHTDPRRLPARRRRQLRSRPERGRAARADRGRVAVGRSRLRRTGRAARPARLTSLSPTAALTSSKR